MDFEKLKSRALLFLRKRGFVFYKLSEVTLRLLELVKQSSAPRIRPYHVEAPNFELLDYIDEYKPVFCAEQKFDGMHVQIAPEGVFKHNGEVIAVDQLGALIYVSQAKPELMERVLSAVEEGYVVEAEIFGSHYSPAGFHLDHEHPFDLVVFEIGDRSGFLRQKNTLF